MAVNSESIYGTTASPIGKPEWGRCTAKGNKLYLHVFNWPADGKLDVPLAGAQAPKAYLLADKKRAALPVGGGQDKVIISVPNAAPDSIDSVIVLVTNNR